MTEERCPRACTVVVVDSKPAHAKPACAVPGIRRVFHDLYMSGL